MRKSALALAAASVALVAGTAVPALAHGHGGGSGHGGAGAPSAAATPTSPAHGRSVSFTAKLSGDQEVPTADGPAVGDADGSASAFVKVKGDRVTFALKWKGIGAPTLGHIHQGRAGANGAVKVPLFTSAMPDTVDAAAGQVTLTDAALAGQLRKDPSGFYVNLHSKEFPGGAVRGQLRPVHHPVNPLDLLGGTAEHALMDGEQEVPEPGKKVGDPDGHAIAFLKPQGTSVGFSMAWVNVAAPTLGHVHQGVFGRNGDVKVPLFTSAVPGGVFAVSGTVKGQDPALVRKLKDKPSAFYANLHTSEFPDGAVRGQFFGLSKGAGSLQ